MPRLPTEAPCKTTFTAAHSTVPSPGSRTVWWLVLHSTEGQTARGAAAWFANPKSAGSAHLVVDDSECYRTVDDALIAWGAPGANLHGFHIEQAGFASWSSSRWLASFRTLQRAAYKTAHRCHKYGIPPRFVTAEGLRRGTPGITTHMECTRAFGGTHTDPGRWWPRRTFMYLVRRYHANLAPASEARISAGFD